MTPCAWVLWLFLVLPSGGLGKEIVGSYKTMDDCKAALKAPQPAADFVKNLYPGPNHLVCAPFPSHK